MIGIYKITSPSNRVYIGQSINIPNRFKTYRAMNCHKQVRLIASFKKYGIDKHVFEVIAECEESELNDLERYYQDLYDVLNKKGLNCKLTQSSDRSGRYSEELKDKFRGSNNSFYGKTHTPEVKALLKILNSRPVSEETKIKLREFNTGKTLSEEHKRKIGDGISKTRRAKGLKSVIDTDTNKIYECAKEASEDTNTNFSTMRYILSKSFKGKIQRFKYL